LRLSVNVDVDHQHQGALPLGAARFFGIRWLGLVDCDRSDERSSATAAMVDDIRTAGTVVDTWSDVGTNTSTFLAASAATLAWTRRNRPDDAVRIGNLRRLDRHKWRTH
jgi:hypothetical protein